MNPKRNRDRHKEVAREVAKIFGGKHVGTIEGQDVEAGAWSIEVKTREKFTGCKWIEQAKRNCPGGLTPLVYLHIMGKRKGNDIILMAASDFIEWYVPAHKYVE